MKSPVPSRFFGARGSLAAAWEAQCWSEHPLGPPAQWPPILTSLLRSMNRSRGPMFVCWGEQAHLLYNEHYATVLADKHPAAFGRPLREVWSEIGTQLDAMLARVFAGEGLYGENVPFRLHRDGRDEPAYFTFTWNPVLDEDDQVLGFSCPSFETTSAVQAEQARAAEANRLMLLFQQAPGFVAVLEGPEHVFRHANQAYLDFVGRSHIVGKPVREVAPEAIAQGYGQVLDDVLRTGVPFVGHSAPVRLRRDEHGETEELSVNFIFQPIRGDDGRIDGILIQGYDVTAEVHGQSALRESEAKFRAIADAIPQMVWTTRSDGWVEYFNRQWYAFTGACEGDSEGHGWQQVLHSQDLARTIDAWRHSLATGTPYEIEYRLRNRHGEYRWMLGRALPVRDDAGAIVRWMGTCTEIEDQVRSRESLREDDRRKDEFLAMLAHELRNPLAPITSAVAMLRRAAGDAQRVRSLTDIVERQASHMRGLVDDLLDVSRVTRGVVTLRQEEVDLREVLAEALEQARPLVDGRGHTVAKAFEADPLPAFADRKRLVQVFANLINNAARYTPAGGRIRIAAKARPGDTVIVVEDNGQGMRPELIERVFELFVQGERRADRREGGLGIGLALVRSMVELHGGRVAADSAGPGQGSRFEVVLPALVSPAPLADTPETAGPAASPAGARVLIVDDNEDAATVLGLLLEDLGHEVMVEHTAGRGLATARTFLPQVCLLDIGLPDADGRELGARLRGLPGMERVILAAVSGYGQPKDVAATAAAGMVHFVKPLDPEVLARWLDEVAPAS
ncbi:hybrid sensor histidine kinase/response regulator [Ramlibacter rhizophilus]|nr:ATP-binding protein [Ramlibacter rhizophilus]